MENHHFSWENPLQMAIFNSYFDITRGYQHQHPDSVHVWDPHCSNLLSAMEKLLVFASPSCGASTFW